MKNKITAPGLPLWYLGLSISQMLDICYCIAASI